MLIEMGCWQRGYKSIIDNRIHNSKQQAALMVVDIADLCFFLNHVHSVLANLELYSAGCSQVIWLYWIL